MQQEMQSDVLKKALQPKVNTFNCGTSTVTFDYNGSTVTYGTVMSAGRCWLDRTWGLRR